jgi:hypothetical protein
MTSSTALPSFRAPLVGGLIWLAAAIAIGATGLLARLPPPGPQIVILALTITAVVVSTRNRAVRTWVDSVPLRWLVGVHGVRLIGVVFLFLAAAGMLSPLFATRAGWGDIAAAVGALALVWSGAPRSPLHRWAYLGWNAFGLIDLAVAVVTATVVVARQDVPGMEAMLRLPMSLVPTLLVPLLVASHIVLFRRLLAREPRA